METRIPIQLCTSATQTARPSPCRPCEASQSSCRFQLVADPSSLQLILGSLCSLYFSSRRPSFQPLSAAILDRSSCSNTSSALPETGSSHLAPLLFSGTVVGIPDKYSLASEPWSVSFVNFFCEFLFFFLSCYGIIFASHSLC